MDESSLQNALATRINLQIVISQIPAIEEHMDLPLSRWLDSVPLPPELPEGEPSHLTVWLGSALKEMGWSAWGHPAGFIPKMADYFQKCGMTTKDLDVINEMGEAMEPEKVGSWIRAARGQILTGWQFCQPMELSRIAPHLGDTVVMTKVMSWAAKRDVVEYRRFLRSVGEGATSILDLTLPGDTPAAQLALATEGFRDLCGGPLPDEIVEALSRAPSADVSLGFEFDSEKVVATSVYLPGLPADELSALCKKAGVDYDERIGQIAKMLKADGIDRVEYRRTADGNVAIDFELVPNVVTPEAGVGKN